MNIVTIHDARHFSLEGVQTRELATEDGLRMSLLCFEAGQQDRPRTLEGAVAYQVLEGEAVVTWTGGRERLGKGKLLTLPAGVEHRLENAGGGLLVVMVTQAEPPTLAGRAARN